MATTNFEGSGGIVGTRVDDISSDQEIQLGTRFAGPNGTVFVYCQARAACALYDLVAIFPDYTVQPASKALVDKGYPLGCVPVMQSTVSAITISYYFWVCISGVQSVNGLTGSSASVSAVYTSGTAGTVGTASGSQSLLRGIVLTAANTSGATASCAAVLNNPQSASF